MTVYMYDGINALAPGIARAFPDAPKVAGYVNGPYAWSQPDWALFPHADHVTISVTASANAGDVLDVEAGDARPDQCAGWIAMRKAAGLFRPTIYCNLSTVPAVRAGTGKYVLGRDYDIWVAWYTSDPAVPVPPGQPAASYAAWQYETTSNWDVSRVLDPGWPHRKPPVAPGLPAPEGLSVTPWLMMHVSFGEVKDAKGYTVQVRRDGVVTSYPVTSTHVSPPLIPPGPCEVRVQADGGAWTAWHQVG